MTGPSATTRHALTGAVGEFHYALGWLAGGYTPGFHRSQSSGTGQSFVGHVPLLAAPDPRRLDIRASLRDPMQGWLVRRYRQRSAVPVYLVADLSASMGFRGTRSKLDLLAALTAGAAWSAFRTGDSFGFVGCDERVRRDWLLPATRVRGAGQSIAQRLAAAELTGGGAHGLIEAAGHVGRRRSLVFLASDFHFPPEFLTRLLRAFAHHDLVPVVLWDAAEHRDLPTRGMAVVVDPESGRERTLVMRPALRRRVADAFEQRRVAMELACRRMGTRPLYLESPFDPDQVTRYFQQRATAGARA